MGRSPAPFSTRSTEALSSPLRSCSSGAYNPICVPIQGTPTSATVSRRCCIGVACRYRRPAWPRTLACAVIGTSTRTDTTDEPGRRIRHDRSWRASGQRKSLGFSEGSFWSGRTPRLTGKELLLRLRWGGQRSIASDATSPFTRDPWPESVQDRSPYRECPQGSTATGGPGRVAGACVSGSPRGRLAVSGVVAAAAFSVSLVNRPLPVNAQGHPRRLTGLCLTRGPASGARWSCPAVRL